MGLPCGHPLHFGCLARHRVAARNAVGCPMCRRPIAAEEWIRLDAWEAAEEAEAPTVLVIGAGSAAGGFLQAAGQLLGAAGLAARVIAVHV
eukprot:15436835-Alexandrium_andersonii.AAC.1